MRKYPKIRLIITPLLVLAFALGCVPDARRIPAPSTPEVMPPPLLSISALDDRIAYLEQIMREGQLNDEDAQIAADLLSAYETGRAYLLKDHTVPDYDAVIQAFYEALARFDDYYFIRQGLGEARHSEAVTIFSERMDVIRGKYFSGDYQGVIDDTIELEATFGHDALPVDIRLLFAVSLSKQGLLEQASVVGESTLREFEGRPDLIFLRSHAKDMVRDKYFSGDYQDVIDDTIGLESVFGPTVLSTDIEFLLAASLSETGVSEAANTVVGRIFRELEGKSDLAFVRSLLIEWQLDLGDRDRARQIYEALADNTDKMTQTDHTEEPFSLEWLFKDLVKQRIQREKDAQLDFKNQTLIRARDLIEAEQFEEAIKSIDELKDDPDMADEIKGLKALAIEKLINQERNRAAAYLLRARQTTDPIRKESYLLSSYNRLNELTERYPMSSLIEQLNKDMETVKIELDKLERTPEY